MDAAPEISEFDVVIGVKKKVLEFDVPMEYMTLRKVGYGSSYLISNGCYFFYAEDFFVEFNWIR